VKPRSLGGVVKEDERMWIKDNWDRLVNTDNLVQIEIVDHNEKKDSPSWMVKARTLKSDSTQRFVYLHLTEGHREKAEAQMRLDAIVDAIKNGLNYLELD
jgi:hypothetical protein